MYFESPTPCDEIGYVVSGVKCSRFDIDSEDQILKRKSNVKSAAAFGLVLSGFAQHMIRMPGSNGLRDKSNECILVSKQRQIGRPAQHYSCFQLWDKVVGIDVESI